MVEEVHIAPHYVAMPLGRIVLIRRGSEYCAVKFTEAWKGKTESARFANYESYYQGDGTGDFQSKNVEFKKDTLVDRISVLGWVGSTAFHLGRETSILSVGLLSYFGPIKARYISSDQSRRKAITESSSRLLNGNRFLR